MGNINEIGDTPKGQYALGQVAARAEKRLNDIHKNTPKKEHMTAAEAYPKDATKFRNTMDDAKAEAFYPPYQKLRKHFSQGYNDYKNKKTNESKNIMSKQVIKLTEQDLHNIIKESVERILKEADYETTAQQQERLNKKNKNQGFKDYPGKWEDRHSYAPLKNKKGSNIKPEKYPGKWNDEHKYNK